MYAAILAVAITKQLKIRSIAYGMAMINGAAIKLEIVTKHKTAINLTTRPCSAATTQVANNSLN